MAARKVKFKQKAKTEKENKSHLSYVLKRVRGVFYTNEPTNKKLRYIFMELTSKKLSRAIKILLTQAGNFYYRS